MRKATLLSCCLLAVIQLGAQMPGSASRKYLLLLDDAQLDIGLQTTTIFALDDRAPLSANPHFQAMWNLIKLGASLEALLQGIEEPLNDIDLNQEFGQNGYNKTVLSFFITYGFGESSDVAMQKHFFELAISPGYFKQGNKGMHLHFDYRMNLANTRYGAGANSIDRGIDYELFVGGRLGFDWSFQRSESEAGFFTHLSDEIERIAFENEFTAAQLIMLEDMAETSKVLLPEDVGGRAFHIGPIAGVRVSKKIVGRTRVFLSAQGFYDIMDLVDTKKAQENKRSQHLLSAHLGVSIPIAGEGGDLDFFH
ncbi:MAG TPA: hypothetical protein PKA00_01600 [Saprospiraceae bacterium]|nr:hypothetical protein [Saprospiraceae bacterium]HMQ81564.1 hypothetical protein [Saprospiraceae bacterium]